MEMGLGSILVLISFISVIPYFIVVLLKFFLWKFSFTARVSGFTTFSEIMLRVPLHLNFSILIRIERLALSFSLTSRMLKIQPYGFQLCLLVRNDFNLWATKKIEILQMLEDIRTTLKRKGCLKQTLMQAAGQLRKGANVEYFGHVIKGPSSAEGGGGSGSSAQQQSQQMGGANHQKKLVERIVDKVLTSIEVKLTDTLINFYSYKDEEKKIEEANIKRFYHFYLLDKAFRDSYLCFRIFIPRTDFKVKSLTDDGSELDLHLAADTVLLQNSNCLNKQGVLKNMSLLIKVPMDLKLAADFCHYQVWITIQRGCLNLNKRFLRDITRFVVCMDTTNVIISRIRRLIIKLHYQDELLGMMNQPASDKTGVETLYESNLDNCDHENITDEDIPKKLKVVIEEGLTLMMCEDSKQLRGLLVGGVADTTRQSELIVLTTSQLTFELLRLMKSSYYISCSSDRLAIACNLKPSILVDSFQMETDFSYRRPITKLPITINKMEINNRVKAESIVLNLTYSEVKLIMDIVDIYQEMVHIASVKNVIMRTLIDKEFLKSNLLHLSQDDLAKESQIMLLFQEPKFKDSLINDILFNKIQGKFIAYDPKNTLNIMMQKYFFRLKADKNVDEFVNKMDFLNIQPAHPKSVSLMKFQGMQSTIVINRGLTTDIQEFHTTYDKGHICLNLDYVLGMTREIVDLTVICKTFARKWNIKYKVKEYLKQTVVESLNFTFEETQFLWYMSKTRFLVFRLKKFKTRNLTPFKKDDRINLCYFSEEFSLLHVRNVVDQVIDGIYYCEPSEEKKVSPLVDIKDLEFKLLESDRELKMRFLAKSFESSLPEDIHFCGLVFEVVKQLMISTKWIKQEYHKVKRKHNVQYLKPQGKPQPPPGPTGTQTGSASQASSSRTLLVQVEVADVLLQVDETRVKKSWVNKLEVVDMLKERDVFRCQGQNIFKLLKRLHEGKLNDKVMILQGKSFRMQYEQPQHLLDFHSVYQLVQKLDEAKDFLTTQLFSTFESAIHTYKCDYLAMHARNLLAPLIEAWDVDVKFLMIAGLLNADQNPQLFKTKISDKIFNRYEVQYHYNKLLPKLFYDAELKITKVKVSVQGQQSLVFFADMGNIFKRFDYEDISKSKDPRGQKLSYYQGLDFLRHKMHGKLKGAITTVEVMVYPRRYFGSHPEYMCVTLGDIVVNQAHNQQEVSLRNVIVSKLPFRSFQSAIMKVPLVELQFKIIYNQGKTVNHYTHAGVQNIGQLLEQLKAYSSHEVELESKLNIPSLGWRNDSDRDTTPISEILPQYIALSPVPVLHYQRSHMKFIDQLLSEYVKKTSYANSIPLKRDRDNLQSIKNKRAYLFKLKVKSLISDIMILFSDFKEKLLAGYVFHNQQSSHLSPSDPRTLRIERDKYLAIYQGLMFTMENLSTKMQVSVSRQKDGTHIEMKGSEMKGNFMKLAFLNTTNLFQLRHPCFRQLREKQQHEGGGSLDNMRNFMTFFELNTGTQSQQQVQANYYQELQGNTILGNFKTINPMYVLRTRMLHQEIMIATLDPNSMNPLQGQKGEGEGLEYCRHQTILDDFVFANTDTIQTTVLVSYTQDQEMMFSHNSTQKMEERQQMQQRTAAAQQQQNPLILDMPGSPQAPNDDPFQEEKLLVKHKIDVKGIRFLYTKQTLELIIHHLINSFDYDRLRKTDFVELETSGEKYQTGIHGGKKADQSSSNSNKGDTSGGLGINQTPINVRSLRRVALIGIEVEDPQVNFQNQFTKSQMLLSTAQPTKAVIFGYHKFNAIPSTGLQPLPHSVISDNTGDNLAKSKSGYKIKFHEELVKVDLQIRVVEMDIYVAPTVINLENPTFWISNNQLFQQQRLIQSVCIPQQPAEGGLTGPHHPQLKSSEPMHSENLLRKVFSVSNICFTFDFFFAQFVDYLNPVMAIDIMIEKLQSEMSGTNMWHFIYVLKSILFDRGEKTDEILQGERQRFEEMKQMKLDMIKTIIDFKLNRGQVMGADANGRLSGIINKKIQYTILNGEFKLINFDQMFSRIDVKSVSGSHLIYKNRNSKVDIDIDKILIENYADPEVYRMVLCQGGGGGNSSGFGSTSNNGDNSGASGDAMIKIRTRDKYVVVKEAPWRVYDQFEVFIFPTSIQFTKNFYQQIRNFFFAEMPNLDLDKSMEEIKKYELLVPHKLKKKAQAKYKAKAKEELDGQEKMVLSASPDTQTVMLHSNKPANDGHFNRQLNAAMHAKDKDVPYYQHDQRHEVAPADDNVVKTDQVKAEFPIFFRYTRMNEIIVSITYFHKKNSFFNSKDLKIKITPFIRHGKFVNFQRLFEKYEHHCKNNFIKQIPSLLKQKFLRTRETFKGGVKQAAGTVMGRSAAEFAIEDDDDDEKMEGRKEVKLLNARKIMFGDYYQS